MGQTERQMLRNFKIIKTFQEYWKELKILKCIKFKSEITFTTFEKARE